ncbi:hypothetical protein OF83DRAFT_1179171 [Amylostereum chailletii]|nr:hypothetical protein OF83DRAFT_1179171 [Amylostereum chailletii]
MKQAEDMDMDMDNDAGTTAATASTTMPTRLTRAIATNARITPVRQDDNSMTDVSMPVVAKLGPKSRKSVTGTPRCSGRKTRWTTAHLDEAVRPTFNSTFMSTVRERVGTLPPFASPSAEVIQEIFDETYPEVKVVVAKGEVTMQRLNEWRSMISSEALNNIKAYLEIEKADDTDHAEGRWCFASAAEYVKWVLHSEDGKNAPMYWARWNGGVSKESRFQFHLILKTLSAHLVVIPSDSKERPSGALLLSLLAVERALKFSRSGTPVIPHGPEGFFSAENWGDQTVRTKDGRVKLNRKASKFFSAVDALSSDAWSRILAGAYKWLDEPSEAEDEVIEESDDDDRFMMSSDPPGSDDEDEDELEEDDACIRVSGDPFP